MEAVPLVKYQDHNRRIRRPFSIFSHDQKAVIDEVTAASTTRRSGNECSTRDRCPAKRNRDLKPLRLLLSSSFTGAGNDPLGAKLGISSSLKPASRSTDPVCSP